MTRFHSSSGYSHSFAFNPEMPGVAGDENVELSELFHRFRCSGFNGNCINHIHLDRLGICDLRFRGGEILLAGIPDADLRAFIGEARCDSQPQPGCASGDDCALSFKTSAHDACVVTNFESNAPSA